MWIADTVPVAGFPAMSATVADADKLSPSPVMTEFAGQAPVGMPESASLQVQWTTTSPAYQPLAFGVVVAAPVITGAVSSTLMCATMALPLLPATSVALPVTCWSSPSPRETGAVQT